MKEITKQVSIPAAENFPSMGLAAHTPLDWSGRTSPPQGASWVVCIQKHPCKASSWFVDNANTFIRELIICAPSIFIK